MLRPALSLKKLSYDAAQGLVRYRPGKAGLPPVLTWSPLEFMERFAAIIPPPRKHLVRYYGALGSRSKLRRALTAGAKAQASCEELAAGFPVLGLIAATKASRAWAARAPPLPLGGEAEGCQIEGSEDDGRQNWHSGAGVGWPA